VRRSLCSLVVLALAIGVGLAAAPRATGREQAASQRQASLEQAIVREVNRVRVSHGLRPLTLSRGLEDAAKFQTRSLLSQGLFEHDSPASGSFGDRMHRFYPIGGARSWGVGENLLWSSVGIDAAGAVRIWLGSAPHRKIMLDPSWREFGIGAFGAPSAPGVYASAGAVVVVTMDFGSRTPAKG
jgi:uncharacterized protein YkwD